MASIFTHPVIAIGFSPFFGPVLKSKAILLTGIILTVIPDLDVIGFRLGIPYDHVFGHRGLSHSLFFAFMFSGFISWFLTRMQKIHIVQVWVYLFLCMASHGVLDAFTNGGHGVAFFAPFINERYFFSFNPIEVSTLNVPRFFQGQGIPVLKSEIIWVWFPCILLFVVGLLILKIQNIRTSRNT